MGIYVNPGNDRFQSVLRSKIYVDKTGLIEYTNAVLDTENRYICVSAVPDVLENLLRRIC